MDTWFEYSLFAAGRLATDYGFSFTVSTPPVDGVTEGSCGIVDGRFGDEFLIDDGNDDGA